MNFKIEHTWDGFPVRHEPVCVKLSPGDKGVKLEVCAPFFNDPPAPPGEPGKPFSELWNYEVVEAFFLNDTTEQYLEVELCPIFVFGEVTLVPDVTLVESWKTDGKLFKDSSVKKQLQKELALSFKVFRGETNWEGIAFLPWSYFPPKVTKFNSFAIHGSSDRRSYEALYPVPQHELQQGQKPDFHHLEYFKPFSFNTLLGEEWKQPESDLWLIERPDMSE